MVMVPSLEQTALVKILCGLLGLPMRTELVGGTGLGWHRTDGR